MASSTKNTKADRKVVVAAYYSPESVFEIPDGLDLEDTDVVEWWAVKYNCLHIKYVGIDQVEDVESVWDAMESFDMKRPSNCTIEDADVVGYEYTGDDLVACSGNECGDDEVYEYCDLRAQADFDFPVPDGQYCEECSAKMTAEHALKKAMLCGEVVDGEEYELCEECETDICLEDDDFRTQDEFDYLVPDGHYCEECSAKMDAEADAKCIKCMFCRGCGVNKRPDQRNLSAPWGWLTCRSHGCGFPATDKCIDCSPEVTDRDKEYLAKKIPHHAMKTRSKK